MGDEIRIRCAARDEAATLTAIAFAAKRHWGYPEPWIERWRAELTISAAFIAKHEVFVAELDGQAVGLAALVADGDACALEHVWVLPRAMGRGVGRALVAHAVAAARRRGIRRLSIDADPNAAGFYRRLGAVPAGETVTEIEGLRRVRPLFELPVDAEDPRT